MVLYTEFDKFQWGQCWDGKHTIQLPGTLEECKREPEKRQVCLESLDLETIILPKGSLFKIPGIFLMTFFFSGKFLRTGLAL